MSEKIAKEQLKKIIDRIERLEEEVKNIRGDIKNVFDEAKLEGYDIPALKQVLKLRKIDPEKRILQEEMVKVYMDTINK